MTMPESSPIKRNDIDTHRDGERSGREAPMTMSTVSPSVPTTSPARRIGPAAQRLYGAPMTTTAMSVIAAIDVRRPGLKPAKQHLLLFFAQGHHLAWAGKPLFSEALYATDRGVALQAPDLEEAAPITDEALLGTISNVVIRYSGLSPADLRTLVQASLPWQLARKAGDDARIEWAWLTDWFRRPDETDDPDDERPNRAERAEAEAYLASRGRP
jgi:uncharacterized phage-associated protein